jgi:hypothetical protein
MKPALIVCTIALFVCLSACTYNLSQGKQVTDAQVAGLIPGVTSYSEVEQRLGKPDSLLVRANGIYATWRQGTMKTTAAEIPGANTLLGTDSAVTLRKVTLIFDKETGLYRTHSKSESAL